MGYLFLFLALLFGLIKAYCGKKSSCAADCPLNAIIINVVRMMICFLIGIVIALATGIESFLFEQPKAVLIAFLSGVSIACFTVSWLVSVNNSAYMLVEVFVMGGVFIPVIFCRIFYGEPISTMQVIAGLMLVLAVYFMCSCGEKINGEITVNKLFILIICAISSGMTDFFQKVYVKEQENLNVVLFNVYTYLFATIILLAVCVVFKLKEKEKYRLKSPNIVIKPIFYYIFIMAGCLFLNSYFKTLSSKYLDAVLIYPLNQGLAVVSSFIMSATVFKEKINAKGIAGIIIALTAVIIINV